MMKHYYLIENNDAYLSQYLIEIDEIADFESQDKRVIDPIKVMELCGIRELHSLIYPKIIKNIFDRQCNFLRQKFNFPNGYASYNGWSISKWEFDIIAKLIELAEKTKEYKKYCEI